MTTKATHNGTCQICGRLQALPSDKLSLHGYDVKHGYFNGICPGAGHVPLEVSREHADLVAADLRKRAKAEKTAAAQTAASKLFPVYASAGFSVSDRHGKSVRVMVPYADALPHYQAEAMTAKVANHLSTARLATMTADDIQARADKITGKQTLQVRTVDAKREFVPGMKVKISGVVVTITKIEDRVCRGCGPYLNGKCLPHLVYTFGEGRTGACPVRNVRQAAIVD